MIQKKKKKSNNNRNETNNMIALLIINFRQISILIKSFEKRTKNIYIYSSIVLENFLHFTQRERVNNTEYQGYSPCLVDNRELPFPAAALE